MSTLAFARTGTGPTLLLLHGLGASRQSWEPVMPALGEHFDVLAVDLPGFGQSPALPNEVEALPATLAASVADLLEELEITDVHVVGNSLGGWVALELAGLRPVASLTLLSPAGLWKDRTPAYCRVSLRASRWLAQHAEGLLLRLVSFRLGRILVLGQTHGRAGHATPAYGRAAVAALASCPGFEAAFAATLPRRYRKGAPIDAPVTLAFGTRDVLLLPWQSRHVDQLPRGTRVVRLAHCGHLPMSDDPAAVAALIITSTGA
jgi:pimeloyl-ACP methyl ester carboxylesterase